jgi:methylenetetrahydrofolate--tRNA-(uracil-5-)-methyltransferase
MVGFQTKLKYGEQSRVFRMIPGLENAEFARLGGLHRNTFLDSPRLLDHELRLKADPRLRFAGQITGVEGYVESAAIGLLAGRFAVADALGRKSTRPPATTAFGALLAHITGGHIAATEASDGDDAPKSPRSFQPMNINYGLLPPMEPPTVNAAGEKIKGKDRTFEKKRAMSRRAIADLQGWLQGSEAAN